jgi:TonB family protein
MSSFLRTTGILVLAVVVNGTLYLLVPWLQVRLNPSQAKPAQEIVEREVILNPFQPENAVKRPIEEIKPVSFEKPEKLTMTRPTAPGGGLKIDLSPAGGDGPALLSGGDRKGGIGSGTGGGTGSGVGQMIYEMGQTDTDARLIGPDHTQAYPRRAQREGVSGYAELAFVVNELGMVEQVTVLKEEPTGYGFAQAAIEAAKKLRFKPATLQKMSVRQNFRRRFNFEL